ncbi:amino acid ABC transporter permease [Agilicoccus flavus]|uniref:amino acid ABC transporter permease n=1 Tax=Agilicoccus flavus TaxID=2775968 RepID=UPI001CF6F34A|nr:amino acid ABC transporter permease [Agilicoccus flavus]
MSAPAPTAEQAPTRRRSSPRRRARRIRLVQYAVLIVLVVLALFTANWPQIIDVFFRPELVAATIGPALFLALGNTLIYTAGAFLFGLVVGTVLALMRLSEVPPYRWIARAYIEFFRGLPAIVVFIAFGLLPIAFEGMTIPWDPYGTVWVALGMVASAYLAETIRAGIQAVPKGQVEAARSLGMSSATAMRKIVLPQAFRIILPPLTNELILLVKDSSLVYVLGLSIEGYELTKFGREAAQSEANLTPLVVAGFCYLLITLPLTVLVGRLEATTAKAR